MKCEFIMKYTAGRYYCKSVLLVSARKQPSPASPLMIIFAAGSAWFSCPLPSLELILTPQRTEGKLGFSMNSNIEGFLSVVHV